MSVSPPPVTVHANQNRMELEDRPPSQQKGSACEHCLYLSWDLSLVCSPGLGGVSAGRESMTCISGYIYIYIYIYIYTALSPARPHSRLSPSLSSRSPSPQFLLQVDLCEIYSCLLYMFAPKMGLLYLLARSRIVKGPAHWILLMRQKQKCCRDS